MRFIRLSTLEYSQLEHNYRYHSKFYFRQRCKALLLSYYGMKVGKIAKQLEVGKRAIYNWMNRWQSDGIDGLKILPGRGMKPKLSITDNTVIELIKKKVKKNARSLRQLCAQLTEELDFKVTRDMLRKFLKRLGYTWKRFRKSLKGKQNKEEYEAKLVEIKQLIEDYKAEHIDLFFADESGFNMEGYIPYGWQPKNEYIHITPSKNRRINVFGIMSLDQKLEPYCFNNSLDSQCVIACINDFCKKIEKKTVIVIDNAPIDTSYEFKAQIKKWEEKNLFIFFLPTYSPHLNPIEILWRMIKYQWLDYENFTKQEHLKSKLDEILINFGKGNYTINFKEHKKVSIIYR